MPADLSDIFVGREREMEQLTAALDDDSFGEFIPDGYGSDVVRRSCDWWS